jgi:superfamily I DNA/RNA helicase
MPPACRGRRRVLSLFPIPTSISGDASTAWTCALVIGREDVRQALGQRYQHIFVDEFQDTDPIQAEILFFIGAERRPDQWQEARLRPASLFLVGDPKQAIYRFRGADIGIYQQARENVERRSGGAVVQVTANFRSQRGLIDYVNNRTLSRRWSGSADAVSQRRQHTLRPHRGFGSSQVVDGHLRSRRRHSRCCSCLSRGLHVSSFLPGGIPEEDSPG